MSQDDFKHVLSDCKKMMKSDVSVKYIQTLEGYLNTEGKFLRAREYSLGTEFLKGVLRLCTIAKLQNSDYYDVFFNNDLSLPKGCSHTMIRILRRIVGLLLCEGSSEWLGEVKVRSYSALDFSRCVRVRETDTYVRDCVLDFELRLDMYDTLVNLYRNCLSDNPDYDLVRLLSWSLQWITAGRFCIADGGFTGQYDWYRYIENSYYSPRVTGAFKRLRSFNKQYRFQCESVLEGMCNTDKSSKHFSIRVKEAEL